MGVAAVLVDLVAGIAGTYLEFLYWGVDGFTPDLVISYIAVGPQILTMIAYLALAKEIAARGLWKSAAGMLLSYLLFCVIDAAMVDELPTGVSAAVLVVVALGIVGLFAFVESDMPRFRKEAASDPAAIKPREESSDGPGCVTWAVIIVLFVLLRFGVRKILRDRFDVDSWLLLELAVVALFGLAFAVWFAVAKMRLRGTLGPLAGTTGGVEIIILLIHGAMLAVVGIDFFAAIGAETEMTEEAMQVLFDSWFQPFTLISSVCHAIWAGVTVAFFVSVDRKSRSLT